MRVPDHILSQTADERNEKWPWTRILKIVWLIANSRLIQTIYLFLITDFFLTLKWNLSSMSSLYYSSDFPVGFNKVYMLLFYRSVKYFIMHCYDCVCRMCIFHVQSSCLENSLKILSTLADRTMVFNYPSLPQRGKNLFSLNRSTKARRVVVAAKSQSSVLSSVLQYPSMGSLQY